MAIKNITLTKRDLPTPIYQLVRGDRLTSGIMLNISRFDGSNDLSDLGWAIKIQNAVGDSDVQIFNPTVTEMWLTYEWNFPPIVASEAGRTIFEIEGVNADGEHVWQSGKRSIEVIDDLDATPEYDAEGLTIFQQAIDDVGRKVRQMGDTIDAYESRIKSAVDRADESVKRAESATEAAAEIKRQAESGEFNGRDGNDWIPTTEEIGSIAENAAGKLQPTIDQLSKSVDSATEAIGKVNCELTKKVGYSEMVNGQLLMYSDSSKKHLLATLDLPPVGTPTDVRINGQSITQNGVADIPPVGDKTLGLVRSYANWGGFGIKANPEGYIYVSGADEGTINGKTDVYMPVTPKNIDSAVRAGLVSNTKITDSDKPLICETIGAEKDEDFVLIEDVTVEEDGYFTRTAEPDGTPYNFKALMIRVAQPTANGIGFRIRDAAKSKWIFYGSSGSAYKNAVYKCWRQHGLLVSNVMAGNDFSGSGSIVGGTYESFGKTIGYVQLEIVKGGSNIKIYGVRA